MKMPIIDKSKLSAEAKTYADAITNKKGELFASKPSKANGKQKFVWRMVALLCSPKQQHQCMPVTAVFDLQDYYESYGVTSDKSYGLAKNFIKENKSLIAELQDAFGYNENTLPRKYLSFVKGA